MLESDRRKVAAVQLHKVCARAGMLYGQCLSQPGASCNLQSVLNSAEGTVMEDAWVGR